MLSCLLIHTSVDLISSRLNILIPRVTGALPGREHLSPELATPDQHY